MQFFFLCGLCFMSLLTSLAVKGQPAVETDTGAQQVLTPERFNKSILQYHPMARRADLVKQQGPAKLQKARGNFDPKLFSDWDAKEFQSSSYYRIAESGLKIPTWFGIDVKLYHEQNRGINLNPERKVPDNGLYGVGLEVPVGQGLFTDERRTALNKAKIMRDVQVNKRHQLLMKLLSKGFQDFWKWAGLSQRRDLINQTVEKAQERFADIKTAYRGGERTAIDTTEALSQLQQFRVKQRSINGKYQQQTTKISTYLWDEDQQPRSLANNIQPPDITAFSNTTFKRLLEGAKRMDSVANQHPSLLQYRNKLELLSIENQWRKEQLKPTLDLKYHALQNAGNTGNLAEQQANDDLKWGVAFQFPIFLRKERGQLKVNELKQRSTELRFEQQQLALQRRLEGAQQRLEQLYQQIKTSRQNLDNFKRLLEAEETLYKGGESSLLKVNLRELKYLQAQLKQVKYISTFLRVYSELRYRYTYQRSLADQEN